LQANSVIEKLADLAKSKVSLDEFTAEDRQSLLELFINNEAVIF